MANAQVRLELAPNGGGRVWVNGQELTELVTGWAMVNNPPSAPQLQLTLAVGAGEVEGLAAVAEVQPGVFDLDAVVAFLGMLDPAQLEADVLAGLGYGDSGSYTAKLLERLLAIAKGEG